MSDLILMVLRVIARGVMFVREIISKVDSLSCLVVYHHVYHGLRYRCLVLVSFSFFFPYLL